MAEKRRKSWNKFIFKSFWGGEINYLTKPDSDLSHSNPWLTFHVERKNKRHELPDSHRSDASGTPAFEANTQRKS